MKVYFAGAIRGEREKVYDYQKMVNRFEDHNCIVLTKHIANPNISQFGENLTPREIYDRDCKWLKEADIVFADITIPSLGVGYEIAEAEKFNKKIYAIYEADKNVSGFLRGDPHIEIIAYNNINEILEVINKICSNTSIVE